MGGVHIHDNQSLAVFRQNVNTLKLRYCKAQRRNLLRSFSHRSRLRVQKRGVRSHLLAHATRPIARMKLTEIQARLGKFCCTCAIVKRKRGRINLLLWLHLAERLVQAAKQEIMHHARITKAHFVLLWVHVDIQLTRVHRQ